MKLNIKKSFKTLLKNPHIMLLFVTYLLIGASALPLLMYSYKTTLFYVLAFLLSVFTVAFFAGWLGMIKCIVSHVETNDPLIELEMRYYSFKHAFFSSVASYILPVAFYFLLLIAFIFGITKFADIIFGRPIDILNQMALYKGDTEAIYNFATTIPKNALKVILERNLFRYFALLIYAFLTFYSLPALYSNRSKNPLMGLKNGLFATFKKPLNTLILFITIVLAHIFLVFFEALSLYSPIIGFIALVLRVSFLAYVIVLIFSVYEENYTDNCNNGCDSLGENEACN